MLRPSRHTDTFTRSHLPPVELWPELVFRLPALAYPDEMNCAEALLERAVAKRGPAAVAILAGDQVWSYADLIDATDRIARVLVEDFGLEAGGRVLLRGGNTPELFAAWLGVIKVGGVAVSTMPMLRSAELAGIVGKSRPVLALCHQDLIDELVAGAPDLRLVAFGEPGAELERRASTKSGSFRARRASQDDVCLIAFTSGTTGEPKAAAHFHRDVLSMCHTYGAHVLADGEAPVFSGTPPIAFTFGLGGLLVFPLFFGAPVVLPEPGGATRLADAIAAHQVTHLFTSPTGYRQLLAAAAPGQLASLRACVSAGEHLSAATWNAWREATGLPLLDGLGATEMMHIFLSATARDAQPGCCGRPVPGFEIALLGDDGREIPGPGEGRLAVRGPVGCRYLADARQREYVQRGWNVTGDIFRRDAEGRYWYVARADDMIISSGYNIAGPEVEAAIATHPDVTECAVVGTPDAERGQIATAYVVLGPGATPGPAMARALQDHVKRALAPYKYPRSVRFVAALPRTATGKVSRRALREAPPEAAGGPPADSRSADAKRRRRSC
ncbi:AMP-binding protein [Phenylobacterium sp.]|uniref:AMP-binding protein n=1 Tax=Phenylobacterium sp. TaxID=1871053 RepID=UPI00301B79D9